MAWFWLSGIFALWRFLAEPALRQKRAEPFGQRESAHVHVHAHTLASLAAEHDDAALLEVASVEDCVPNRDGR